MKLATTVQKARKCGQCGVAFPVKSPRASKPALVQQTLDFGETVELLGKVKLYAKDFGGPDKLAGLLDGLEEITMQTGGLDGLKKALEALKKL